MSNPERIRPPAPSDTSPNPLLTYGAAIAWTAVAFLIRLQLDPYLGDHLPFVTFLAATFITAWHGGIRPALFALFLGALATLYWFAEPRGQLGVRDSYILIRLLVDFSVGLIILLLTAQLRAAKHRAEMSMREADINVGLLRAEFEQRERLAQILEESEVRFRMMADTAPLMIWINDENKQSTYVSRGWLDFTGQSHDDAIAQGWMNAIHPDDRDRVTRYMFDCIDRREPFTVEYRLRHHSGEYRWMLDHGVPRFTSGGEYLGYIGTVLDISAQKETEQRLRDSGERFRVALQNSATTVFMQDADLRYTWIHNPVRGMEPGDILGKTDMELHVSGVREELTAIKQRVIETGKTTFCEVKVELGGRKLIQEMTLEPLHDPAGNVIGLTGAAHDITDRKRVENALRESEERLRIVLENIPMLVVGIGEGDAPVFWNRECERVTGYPASEVLGNAEIARLLFPERELRKQIAVRRANSSGDYENWLLPITTQDGTRRYVAWTNISKHYPIPGWQNWVVGIDVTERHKAQERANRLQAVTEKLSEAVTPAEISRLIVSPRFTGLDAHIAVVWLLDEAGANLVLTSEPHIPEEMQNQLQLIRLDEQTPMTDCVRLRQPVWLETADAYRKHYPDMAALTLAAKQTKSMACVPLMVEGRVIGAIGLSFPEPNPFEENERAFIVALARLSAQALDRARLYEAQAEARREAEEANELKTKFLAMISHELRTPLTSIKGFTTTLLASDIRWGVDEQNEFLQIIDSEAEKLKDLVEQLLDVSTLQAGTLRIYPSPQRLTDIIDISRAQIVNLARNHELVLEIPDMLPPILADSQRLAQVIGNLVENAVKYSPEGSRLSITASQVGDAIRIDVSDEGVGIEPKDRDTIFEAFRQGQTAQKGVGLGLAICKGLVEAHGGRIWVQGRDGPGATVSFTVPVTLEPVSDQQSN